MNWKVNWILLGWLSLECLKDICDIFGKMFNMLLEMQVLNSGMRRALEVLL